MNVSELKTNFHLLIDQIDNANLLEEYYREMKKIVKSSKSNIWDTLSEKQKQEVFLSYEESEDEVNLIVNEDVMKPYKKWL